MRRLEEKRIKTGLHFLEGDVKSIILVYYLSGNFPINTNIIGEEGTVDLIKFWIHQTSKQFRKFGA